MYIDFLIYLLTAFDKILARLGCSLEDIPRIVHQNQQYTAELIPRLQSKIVALEQALTEIVEDREAEKSARNFVEEDKEESTVFMKGIPDELMEDAEDDNSAHSSTIEELKSNNKSKVKLYY